jgi:hypothetical protein
MDEAQLTRLPFEGLKERLDLRGGVEVAVRLDLRIAGLMGMEVDRFRPILAVVMPVPAIG